MTTVVDKANASESEERIAAALLGRGRLKDTDLARAQRLQAEAGGSLATLLVRLGLVSERDMAEAASEVLGLPLLAAKDCPDAPPENLPLSLRFLKQQAVCPVGENEWGIDLLVADPQDDYGAEAVRLATGRDVRVKIEVDKVQQFSDMADKGSKVANSLTGLMGSWQKTIGALVALLGAIGLLAWKLGLRKAKPAE